MMSSVESNLIEPPVSAPVMKVLFLWCYTSAITGSSSASTSSVTSILLSTSESTGGLYFGGAC